MNVLAIDTATQILGVGILRDSEIVGEMTINIKKTHTARLLPAIQQLMERVEMQPDELDKMIVGQGPGSYTGVRIGVTTAKSLAWALDLPLISVSSLEALAYQGRFFSGYICPFFDARRQAIYTGLYEQKKGQIIQARAEKNILMEDWLKELKSLGREVLFLSPDVATFQAMIQKQLNDHGVIPEKPYHMLRPAHLLLAGLQKEPQDLHAFTPNYLRIAEAEKNWIKLQEKKNK